MNNHSGPYQSDDDTPPPPIAGIILAGGRSRRMGDGDKAWKKLGDRFLIEHVVARAARQVDYLAINTAAPSSVYDSLNIPIVPDCLPGHLGPLAGVLSGLEWARDHKPPCPWLASFAVDTPFFPDDLVACLLKTRHRARADIACAVSGSRHHRVFALWPVGLADDLKTCLQQGTRKIEDWTNRHQVALHPFVQESIDPFFNINRPQDLAAAENMMATLCAAP